MKPNAGPEPSLADIISKKIKENSDLGLYFIPHFSFYLFSLVLQFILVL